jgi:hypothetical protein
MLKRFFAWIVSLMRHHRIRYYGDSGPPVTPPLPQLGALSFSSTVFIGSVHLSGTILGATAGSTITATGLPTGLTINGPARTWDWTGGTGSNGSFVLTETLSGYGNSPLQTTINYTRPVSGPPPSTTSYGGILVLSLEDI